MNRGRPLSLGRQAEDVLMDFALWEAKAMADGKIDGAEARSGVPILKRFAKVTRKMAPTWVHVATCVTSEDGMFSDRSERGWSEAHRNYPKNMIAFPGATMDPEAA